MRLSRIYKAISNPKDLLLYFIQVSHIADGMDDEKFLKLICRLRFGKGFNISEPRIFSEKINWLKLHNRNPKYTEMVDKYTVKKYVSSIIGDQYIIPTLGVWNSFDEIDFAFLPDQFVLKTTHGGGSGGVVICKDKTSFDKKAAKKALERSLNSDIYKSSREWPYKNVPKRIIAEKFMASVKTPASEDLPDYKFFCFNGEPKFCQVIRDRHSKETIDFYDMDWQHQEFVGLNPVARNGLNPVARPEHLDGMKDICRKLAKDIPFVRVDLYVIDDKEYFGELTFFPASGLGIFTPIQWNERLGGYIDINSIK